MHFKQIFSLVIYVTWLHGVEPDQSPAPVLTTPSDEVDAGDCTNALVQCRVDFSKTGQRRADLLVLRRCITEAPCETDEDVEERDKTLFTVNSNFFYFLPEDDERGNQASLSTCASTLTLTIAQVLLMTSLFR